MQGGNIYIYIYSLDEQKQIRERTDVVMMKTGTFIKRLSCFSVSVKKIKLKRGSLDPRLFKS